MKVSAISNNPYKLSTASSSQSGLHLNLTHKVITSLSFSLSPPYSLKTSYFYPTLSLLTFNSALISDYPSTSQLSSTQDNLTL